MNATDYAKIFDEYTSQLSPGPVLRCYRDITANRSDSYGLTVFHLANSPCSSVIPASESLC